MPVTPNSQDKYVLTRDETDTKTLNRGDPAGEKKQSGRLFNEHSQAISELIALSSIPRPASIQRNSGRAPLQRRFLHDRWLIAVTLLSLCTSVIATTYYYETHQILLLGDSYAHMLIARRIFDNMTPGIAQLGGIWLPLPHILLLPFIWNDFLWHTGLAGSMVSMPCFIVSAMYVFATARRLTHNNLASFIGTLAFIVCPNALYLQSTPMSELVLIATMTIACYYFLAWAQNDTLSYLTLAAGATFFATLARYDAWPLFLAFVAAIPLIGWLRKHRWARIQANLILFCIMGGAGIFLWFAWCEIIFKNPLYFQNSPFSSQAQQQALIKMHYLFTYHDLWQSLRTYSLDAALNVGPILLAIVPAGILIFYIQRRIIPETIAIASFFVPFVFYVFSLYSGQAALFVPGASPAHAPQSMLFYNTRYGIEMLTTTAVFLAVLIHYAILGKLQWILQVALGVLIIVQAYMTSTTGIVSLQSGLYGLDCAPTHPIVVYLAQHYNGGQILSDTFTSGTNALGLEVGVDFKDVIYEGSGSIWNKALANPTPYADWIEVNPTDPNDIINKHINIDSPIFQENYTLAARESSGLSLYRKNTLANLPIRPVDPEILTEHRLCGN